MALKMLAAYYSRGCDSADLFRGFQIEGDETFQEHLNQYDVIFLNMQQFLIEAESGKVTQYLEQEVLRELRKEYGEILDRQDMGLAQRCGDFSSYWIFTETYGALKIYMDMDFDGLKADIVQMLGGGHVRINTRSFRNDMRTFHVKDDVLTLLIHLGYLAYDSREKEAFIPNKEIIGEFENAMSVGGWPEIMRILKASEKLLEDTVSGNEEKVAEGLDRVHMEAASILTYNDENSLSCAIGLAYYSARKDYKLIREFPAGKGFADVVFLPLPHTDRPALVVELKYNKSTRTALQQIKDRHYTEALEGYVGEVLLVAVNYDKDNKNKPHSCVIERVLCQQ